MNTTRRLGATLTATLLTLVAGFTAATSAFAYVAPPDTGGAGAAPSTTTTTTTGGSGSSNTLTYVLVAIAAVAFVVLLTASLRLASRRNWGRHTPKVA
jgi:hypothetical protein